MSPKRWRRVKEIFHSALEHEPATRTAFLDDRCGDDEDLRREVNSLLAAHEAEPEFIERPAIDPSSMSGDGGDDPRGGTVVGRYLIERRIASGGMGVVYLAKRADDAYQTQVAVKILRVDRLFDTPRRRIDLMRRFRRERQTLANLNHPNIARLHDGGTTDEGLPYFVMDYIDGRPIDEYCDAEKLSTNERLEMFRTVCGAVHYAHQRLVVHRDLKPSNTLVDSDGTPHLLDFGIAKLLDGSSARAVTNTRTGAQPMTPEYASPEQIRGDRITTATDVYSLGVILYELLTGHRPYRLSGMPRHELGRVICEQQPDRPSTIVMSAGERPTQDGFDSIVLTPESVSLTRDGTPDRLKRQLAGDLDLIVLKALRKEPQRRYASAEELSEDVRRHLSGEAILARPSSLVYQVRVFTRRNKLLVGAFVMVLAALVTGFVASTVQYFRAERRKAEAVAVTEFLSDTLASVDPAEAKGQEPTVREVLRRAALQIDDAFPDQPLVAATLRTTIGNTFRALGDRVTAERHLSVALALRRDQLGTQHPDTLRSANNLTNLLADAGRYEEAEEQYRRTLAAQKRILGDEHPDTLASMNNLAAALQFQGKLKAARSLHRNVLAVSRRTLGEEHPDTLQSMHNLANVLGDQGKLDEAEELHRRVLEARRRILGEEHPETLASMRNLALVLGQARKLSEAEKYHRETLALERRVHGENHPKTLSSLGSLAVALVDVGKLGEAEALLHQVLEGRRTTLGEEHPDTLQSMDNLANVLAARSALDDAEVLHRRTIELRRRVLGEEHADTLLSMNNLANVLSGQGKDAEAAALHQQTLATQRRVLGDRHPDTLVSMNNVAHVLMGGEPAAALAMAKRTVELSGGEPYDLDTLALAYKVNDNLSLAINTQRRARAMLPQGESRLRSAIETRLVSFLREHGDHEAADAILDDALAQTRRSHGEQHAELVHRMTGLALMLLERNLYHAHEVFCDELAALRQGSVPQEESRIGDSLFQRATVLLKHQQYTEAETIIRVSLQVMETALPKDDWFLAGWKSLLGATLVGQDRFAEAEPLLQSAWDRLQKDSSAPAGVPRVTLERLVALYTKWKKPDQAARYRRLLGASDPVKDAKEHSPPPEQSTP